MKPISSPSCTPGAPLGATDATAAAVGLRQRPARARQTAGPHLLQRGARIAPREPLHQRPTTPAGAASAPEWARYERLQAQLQSQQALSESLRQVQEGIVDSAARQREIMQVLQR